MHGTFTEEMMINRRNFLGRERFFLPQIVVVVYDERQMPDGPDMTSVLGMLEDTTTPQIMVDMKRTMNRPWISLEVYGWCYWKLKYPLVNIQKTMERSTIFNGKIHYFYGHFQYIAILT